MSTGDIVELDESGEKYFIPAHRHEVLTDPSQLAVLSWALPIIAGAEDDVYKCFQKDGPRGEMICLKIPIIVVCEHVYLESISLCKIQSFLRFSQEGALLVCRPNLSFFELPTELYRCTCIQGS